MRNLPLALVVTLLCTLAAREAHAMCGCFLRPAPRVGETASAKIINKSSKVILARDGETTVMTMANDFVGAPAEFGMVVPVPTVVKKEDVKIADEKIFDALETQTAPIVTEIFEDDGCARGGGGPMAPLAEAKTADVASAAPRALRASDYGVKVESHFFAGEYEIAVLSGKDASGLVAWLQKFHYDIPDDAKLVLESYIKQKMMFFLARVYVKEMGNERRHLRPIQVKYNTPKLMLPIRLGMVNADGPQELLLFTLTKSGRVETTNYRTVEMPQTATLPWFVKDSWNEVYGAMFDEQEKRESNRVVFLESATTMGLDDHLRNASRFLDDDGVPVSVTRLHFRYADADFPEDLQLQATSNKAWHRVQMQAVKPAPHSCQPEVQRQSRQREQATLANLTGWPMEKVLARVGGSSTPAKDPKDQKWYEKLWK